MRLARSTDRTKSSPYSLVSLVAVEEVGVDLEGDVGVAVAEDGGDGYGVDAVGDES